MTNAQTINQKTEVQNLSTIKALFYIACAYDAIIGAAFVAIPSIVFEYTNTVPPNHLAFIQFPALILLVFAYMFYNIARNPVENKELILYGILLKASYCLVIFIHWILTDIAILWKPFAVMDLLFIFAFLWANNSLKK